jgi:hypothetical protein
MYYGDEDTGDGQESIYSSGLSGLGATSYVDHIPAQNQAGNDLAAVVSQWANAKTSGAATVSLGTQLADRARQIGATFYSFAISLNNSRATAGANEIRSLANNIGASIDSDVGKLPPAPSVLTPPQQTVVQPQPTNIVDAGIQAITRTIDRVVGDVIPGAVPQGPTDYGLPPAAPSSGLPDWLLPAAAGIAIVMFLGRK